MKKTDEKPFALRVAETIDKHHVFCTPELLVALSGGADSVALLCVLMELGYKCIAVHCNFQLRDQESVRDEQFVRQLCKNLNVRLDVTTFDTLAYAHEHGVSIEMAARDLRYSFFEERRRHYGIDCVAVAHHRDDNVETILLNMVRGTGIKGLSGMAYRRDHVARPLLDVSRQEILAYLASKGQNYVDDSTNAVPDVKRNVVRLKIMPILRELNPSIESTLVRNSWQKADSGALYIDKVDVKSHLALFGLLDDKGFTTSQIDDIWKGLGGTPGAVYESATHRLLRDRKRLVVERKDMADHMPAIKVRYADIAEYHTVPRTRDVACLDADKVGPTTHQRRVTRGDRFVPLGMKDSKLVSDYLTNIKMNKFDKQRQTVLTNGSDIVWLVGQRIDERYKVDEGKTHRLIICEIISNKDKVKE